MQIQEDPIFGPYARIDREPAGRAPFILREQSRAPVAQPARKIAEALSRHRWPSHQEIRESVVRWKSWRKHKDPIRGDGQEDGDSRVASISAELHCVLTVDQRQRIVY